MASGNPCTPPQRILIIGGRSLLGQNLALALSREGCEKINLFDILETSPPRGMLDSNLIEIFRGDVVNEKHLKKAIQGVDTVFHIASYGMSGAEGLDGELIQRINVEGSRNVIERCLEFGVKRLIYTSTYNVVFGGHPSNEIENGDESAPYLHPDMHCDYYSKTKAEAEKLILKANGVKTREGHPLRTCSIRPAAIYGEGERRHFARIVKIIKQGLYVVTIGQASAKQDWVHIDNLVFAHTLAAKHLTDTKKGPGTACGQAYFINDGESINTFQFVKPLVLALNRPYPSISLPYSLAMRGGQICEILYYFANTLGVKIEPFLTRCEVNKCARMHTFRIDKARRELGYYPKVNIHEGRKRHLKWVLQQEEKSNRNELKPRKIPKNHHWLFRLALILALLFVFLCAFCFEST
mmetsp:Transcript_16308/g.25840  ORF Transcript_16308/g.25840 Transcript_16308/m.25840 type:complete len:410 (-) Transcript_16308:41-1270(-)